MLALDGCRGGWCGVLCRERAAGEVAPGVFGSVEEAWALIKGEPGAELAVDMPIGLPWEDLPSRPCDEEARRLLGKGLGSRVFPTPARAALFTRSHTEAVRLNRAATGKGVSAQAYHLLPKIREVDAFLSEFPEASVREVHPELCFMRLNGGQPVRSKKKSPEGFRERWGLLEERVPGWMAGLTSAMERTPRNRVKSDDWLDATAIAASWFCHECRWAETVPAPLQRDERGRPMQIAY